MNLNNKMNYSEKISEFIDGELSQEEISELFHKLANEPELQNELRNSLKLKNMFHQELLTPPPLAKTHVYGKLNLQRSAVVLSFLLTAFINIRRFIMTPAFGSALIAISLFTLGLFMTNTSDKKIASNVNSKNNITLQSNTENQLKFENQIPIVSSFAKTNDLKINAVQKPKNSSLPKNNVNSENDNILNNNTTTETFQTLKQPAVQTQENNFIFNQIERSGMALPIFGFRNNIKSANLTSIGYEISSILESLSISVNKSITTSTLQTELQPLSTPLLNNYYITLSYTLDHHNTISAELGQENFQQKYNGVLNGFDANIEQVYTAQWYGLSYQYNFGEIQSLYDLNPYVKVLVGGTNIGPFLKGSLGVSYQLTDKIALQTAVEASRLHYNFQNNWFQTSKYGVIYGIRVGF